MKKALIVGASGRMGQELIALAINFNLQVSFGVTRSKEKFEFKTVEKIEAADAAQVDVVIDFSLPELTDSVLKWCLVNKKALVSGVTGVSQIQKDAFKKAGESIPCLWSPNMSLGIAVMSKLFSALAKLEGADFQIEELHHKRKKDAPSGTALFLQEKLEAAVGSKLPEPVAIRGGGIFGIHRAWAMGEEEMITIEHTAMNRRVFARGAMKAAQWLVEQSAGSYVMTDVLGADI